MRTVLYDVDWQIRRIDTLKDRQANGGWTTREGTQDNLEGFLKYMFEPNTFAGQSVRMFRVHNMLNAVVMGYHGQKQTVDEFDLPLLDELIVRVRDFKSRHGTDAYNVATVQQLSDNWDWLTTGAELEELWEDDFKTFDFLRMNLKLRATKGNSKTRSELHKFLGLMDKAMGLTVR